MRARSAQRAHSRQQAAPAADSRPDDSRSYDFGDRIVSIATRIDRFYAARYHSPWRWRWINMDADHNLFSGQWSRSDHFPVVATLETATARKSTAHELKIDNRLYADPKVRKIINQSTLGSNL
eukprot:scaffold5143_cov119-Isochrysis_galbana.AAC.1